MTPGSVNSIVENIGEIFVESAKIKQGFGAIFDVFSTKCFKFYLYLPITHFCF
jgi:hypothetical protein